jgi:hypothetical protein
MSVRARRTSFSCFWAKAERSSASAMPSPLRAAESRPSAERAAETRCSSCTSVVLPLLSSARARSSACCASTWAASAWTIWLFACAIAASARVTEAAFCASVASMMSRDSRARTSPWRTTAPSSTRISVMRRPSISGATSTSSRGTSVPVTTARSTTSRSAARTTVTAGASEGAAGFSWAGRGAAERIRTARPAASGLKRITARSPAGSSAPAQG